MEVTRGQAQPGGDDLYFRPTKATTEKVRVFSSHVASFRIAPCDMRRTVRCLREQEGVACGGGVGDRIQVFEMHNFDTLHSRVSRMLVYNAEAKRKRYPTIIGHVHVSSHVTV